MREQVFNVIESPGKLRRGQLRPDIIKKKLPLVAFGGLRSGRGVTALNGRHLSARQTLFGLVGGVIALLTKRSR